MSRRRRRDKAAVDTAITLRGSNDVPYAGASVTRKQLSNWVPTLAHADADLLPNLDLLKARARDLDRNNGVAAGGFETLQENIIGLGLRLAAAPNWRALGKSVEWAEQWTKNVESLWQAYSETCALDVTGKMNFGSLTTLVLRSVLESGEALALPLWLSRNTSPYKTCFQIVDTDRLSNPLHELPSKNLRGGIQLDDYGRPLAYFIRKVTTVPGFFMPFWDTSLEWERIPATTDWGRPRVLHVYRTDRPDQTRGKPILAPVIEQFRMLDSYQRTELQTAIVNALVAGVIETPMDAAGIAEMMGGDPSTYLDEKNKYKVRAEGGTFFSLWPGDKLTPYLPKRDAMTYGIFVETVMRQIGNALGLPYELIAKDFSKVTYASARASLGEAWRSFQTRRQWIADYWAGPVYRLWLEEAISLGEVEAPDYYEHPGFYNRSKWIGPGRNQIDPVKEAQATQLRLANRTSTLELECAESGLDWNEILEQQALEKARRAQLGLEDPTLDPGAPGANQPQEDPAQEATQ